MSAHKTALLSALTTALLASASLQAAEPLKAVGAGEGQLDIVAWPARLYRTGRKRQGLRLGHRFRKETGCKVNVKTAATSDEMVSLMAKGGYDLVTASGDASLRLIVGKRVQPINTALIPNWKTIDPRLKDAPWYVVGQQTYGTPYQWGPDVLMYNTNVFKTAPTSWNVLFEAQNLPDGKPNKGRVQAYGGPIYIADAALYLKSTKPELGIQSPYELTETQYKAVLDLLRAQQPLIHRYWHDTTVQMSDFKNEGVVASSAWPYQVNGLINEKQPIASTIPKEGATGWRPATTMLHSEAKHPNCAYKWMDWSLQPKVGAMSPPGSAPCRRCRRPAPVANCSGKLPGIGAGSVLMWSADYMRKYSDFAAVLP